MAGVAETPQERLLNEVYKAAECLAGEGKKIKYTHVLEAFRYVSGLESFRGAFEKDPASLNDLQRAESLATLVENVAEIRLNNPSVLVVGHALRQWRSLGAETKGRIDRVFQNRVLNEKGLARFKDRATEFFRDLVALITQSRLSTLEDKKYANDVCEMMKQNLLLSVETAKIAFPKPANRAQTGFLKSAKKLYRQRLTITQNVEPKRLRTYESYGTIGVDKATLEEVEGRIELLQFMRSGEDATLKQQASIDENILKLQLAKAAKYFDMFIANASIQQTGNDAARAEARGNVRAALMRLRDEVGADSPVGQDITKKLGDIEVMEANETRLREQKKSQ